MDQNQSLKGLILGATGAIGRELVIELVKSPNWSEVTVLVRRKLEEWDQFTDAEKQKLKVILDDNLDRLSEPAKWDLQGYSSVFCCLGSRVGQGKETFIKVDRTYPIEGGKLANHFNIPHYSLVTGGGANKKSWFLYLKTKGEAEEGLKELKLPQLSILRPALLLNRRNDDRLGEKIASYIPLISSIKVKDVAKAQRVEAELQHRTPNDQKIITYNNKQCHYLADKQGYPKLN